jgi:phage terminase large subunit
VTIDIPREELAATTRRFQKDPLLFFERILGVETLEEYQKRVIKTVWENDRTAVSACHDVGKTFLAARIAMTFLNVFPNSKVITTAPTFNQVERILWSELRAAHGKAKFPLGGKLNMTDWTFNPEWFALGFSPRNETTGGEGQGTSSSFQGFHAAYLLVIFDEATGIPLNVWNMAEGLMTSANVKFLAIGNPTSTSSEFYQCFRSRSWAKVKLSCFDSPNLIANGITNKAKLEAEVNKYKAMGEAEGRAYVDKYKVVKGYLLTTKWVVVQAAKWGLDHPLTVSKILGGFPDASQDTLVPLGVVEECQLRVTWPTATDRKSIGVDVARFGTDSSVLTALHGMKQLTRKELFQHATQSVVGEVIAMSRDIGGADIVVVDETGLGGGVVDLLKDEIGKGLPAECEVRGVQFGAAVECDGPKDCKHTDCEKAKFANLKARMAGLLRDDMKRPDGLALLNESIYLEEIPSIRYSYNKKGQLVIESKDDFKKRTGRKSPDSFDSLALANYGHYDELKIGKFTKVTNKDTPKTYAGGLNSNRNW